MTSIEDPRQHRFVLNNGAGELPALGFGTLVSDSSETRNATIAAVEVGFRHLDCAERYRNEEEVGAALKQLLADGTVRREDLFVTTKLWNNNHRPERVRPALQASLNKLGLDAVDLYLVHTPFAFQPGDDQDPRDLHGAVVYDGGITLDETWTFSMGGRSVQANTDGSFLIPNISVPDTAPTDLLGDDVVRLVGITTSGGKPRYVFSPRP